MMKTQQPTDTLVTTSQAFSFMLISGVCFAIVHSAVKFISRIPVHEILTVRSIISLSITWFALRKFSISPWGKNRRALFARGVFGTGALLLYFHTLQTMPLASAVTIQYLHPILTVILASFFIREKATWAQWACFLASFIGVLLVKGVDTRIDSVDLAIGVGGACCSAIAYNMIRALRDEDHSLVIVFYLALVSLLVITPWTALHFVVPTMTEWGVLLIIGVFTQIAQYFMTQAYQAESAANISNLNYLGILYASVLGFAVFQETLQALATIGIVTIVASAIISTKLAKRRKPEIVA